MVKRKYTGVPNKPIQTPKIPAAVKFQRTSITQKWVFTVC